MARQAPLDGVTEQVDQGEDLEIVRREVVQVDLRPVEVPGEGIGDVHDEDGDAVAALDLATEKREDFVEAGGGGGHGGEIVLPARARSDDLEKLFGGHSCLLEDAVQSPDGELLMKWNGAPHGAR